MFRRTWLTVDLDRMKKNCDIIRQTLPPGCKLFAVVKANAYGQGDTVCARALEAYGIGTFCVATTGEAVTLRKAGVRGSILILSYVGEEDVPTLLENNLITAVAGYEHAEMLSAAAGKAGGVLRCHLKVNTGMNRIGFDCGTAEQLEKIAAAYKLPNLRFEGIFSHFSSSDDGSEGAEPYSRMQLARWQAVLSFLSSRGIDPGVRHISNSGAIARYPEARYDAVRSGALIAGYNTSPEVTLAVEPCAAWQAAITCIRDIPAGAAVSYSRHFVAEAPTRVATVAIGYADGWPRVLSNRGTVLLHGKRTRILGNICMDQMMVDVTDIPEAKVGDAVTLIGRDGELTQTADDVAAEAGSCMHEIMSRIGTRVERVYVGE